MTLFAAVLVIHISAGTLALSSFLVPFLGKWGGTLHRRAGWVFTGSMTVVAVTAWAMSAMRLLDAEPSNNGSAIFLAHIGLLSAASTWVGIRTVQLKQSAHRSSALSSRLGIHLVPSLLLGASSLGLLVGGALRLDVLWIVFSVIGLSASVGPLRYFLRTEHGPYEWMVQHLTAMGVAAISSVTAFFVVNLESLGLQSFALLFWIGPGVVGGTILSALANRVRAHGLAKRTPVPLAAK
jgi:hypothetical protein